MAGRAAAERVNNRPAPVRQQFIRRLDASKASPPLARIMGAGKGSDVRLKAYLSLIFLAVKAPHAAVFPAGAWAQLLDLESPDTNGARRISDAFAWLEAEKLVKVQRQKGYPAKVTLLEDSGSGGAYTIPGADKKNLYYRLPPSFWSNGWTSVLSGRAIAMLLILEDFWHLVGKTSPFWVPPQRARDLYGISQDTWTRGVRELQMHGLLIVALEYFRETPFSAIRRHNRFTRHPEAFDASPC